MKYRFIAVCALQLFEGCATGEVGKALNLGDSERTTVKKMLNQGARDVTKLTSVEYHAEISLEQRHYWWEFPDKTVAVILVAAPPRKEKKVVTIDIGEAGLGIEGIRRWRSQNLKHQSSLPK